MATGTSTGPVNSRHGRALDRDARKGRVAVAGLRRHPSALRLSRLSDFVASGCAVSRHIARPAGSTGTEMALLDLLESAGGLHLGRATRAVAAGCLSCHRASRTP